MALTTDVLRRWLDTTGLPAPVAPELGADDFVAVLVRDPRDTADPGDPEVLLAWEARARSGVARWRPMPMFQLPEAA